MSTQRCGGESTRKVDVCRPQNSENPLPTQAAGTVHFTSYRVLGNCLFLFLNRSTKNYTTNSPSHIILILKAVCSKSSSRLPEFFGYLAGFFFFNTLSKPFGHFGQNDFKKLKRFHIF